MAVKQVNKRANEVIIGSVRYPIVGNVVREPTSTFAQKQVIGSYGVDSMTRLDTWQVPLYPGYCGIEEAITAAERAQGRSWFTTCNTDHDGYMALPRLVTEITNFAGGTVTPTWTLGLSGSTSVNWTNVASAYDGDANTFAWADAYPSGTNYLYITFPARYYGRVRIKWAMAGTSTVTTTVDGYNAASGSWVNLYSATAKSSGGGYATVDCANGYYTLVRVKCTNTYGHEDLRVYEVQLETAQPSAASGTFGVAAEFNGNLYWARGAFLMKLSSDRTNFLPIAQFSASITALIPSLGSSLYIFLGDSTNYWYMNTSEVLTLTNVSSAYWGIQWDNKLWKLSRTGGFSYTATPNSSSPSWTSGGSVTDIASQIEGLFVGYDSDGNTVIYCATNSKQKVYDSTNARWIDVEVKLPNHPNGGRGHGYWNGAHYFSYGLGVKEYNPIDGVCRDMGLDRDDGVPIEYNGEIVRFCTDSGTGVIFALVDASQITGTQKSSLWVYDGVGWKCWWVDTDDDGSMHDVIVSSAVSSYAVYWECGASIFYAPVDRGNANPRQIGTSSTTLQDSYTTGDDSVGDISQYDTTEYLAQTFTPASTHTVSVVSLKIGRLSSDMKSTPIPSTDTVVTVGIYATDGSGHPTGSALCSATMLATNLPWYYYSWQSQAYAGGGWVDFPMGVGTTLTASTKYAIVVSASGNTEGIGWFMDSTSPTYSGGNAEVSTNSGSTWSAATGDYMFKEYSSNLTSTFASSGKFYSPKTSLGWTVGNKLGIQVRCLAIGNVSTDESVTIYYRINSVLNDITNGWTQLGSAITSAGESILPMPNSTTPSGLAFNTIQFRVDLARGSTNTVTPVVVYLCLDFYKIIPKSWGWRVTLDLSQPRYADKSPAQLIDLLIQAAESDTLVEFVYEDSVKYVRVEEVALRQQTGDEPKGTATVFLSEVRRA